MHYGHTVPTVRDRVVQTAILNVIEPIFDNEFHERSFGFRHGRSCHDALRVVEQQLDEGKVFVVGAVRLVTGFSRLR